MSRNRGLVFIACMFLGMGIGMILDHVSAGTIIGMGVGFLAMAFINRYTKHREEKISRTSKSGSLLPRAVLVFIGVLFILGGLYLAGIISIPQIISWEHIGASVLIALGIIFLLAAFASRH